MKFVRVCLVYGRFLVLAYSCFEDGIYDSRFGDSGHSNNNSDENGNRKKTSRLNAQTCVMDTKYRKEYKKESKCKNTWQT